MFLRTAVHAPPRPSHFAGIVRSFAAKSNPTVSDNELKAARRWLADLNADTIPRDLFQVTFSRSSGPGGQNVNKVSSKASVRIPLDSLLPRVPPIMHSHLLNCRYYAAKSNDLVIQADDSRKQADNVNACFRKLHELLIHAGRETVPGETTLEQTKRVERLQKAEAAGRKRLKEAQSKKKTARRGSGRGDD